MYTEAELRALTVLDGESTVSELATQLNRSVSYTSELVDQLESKGLVHTHRPDKTRRITRSDARAIELLESFVQRYTHIPFPELLGGSTLSVLYFMDTPRSAVDLAARAGVHRSTVYRSLSPLEHRGLVYQTDDGYALNDEFEELTTVAQAFAHHRHRQRIEAHAAEYTIRWESLDECLVQTDTEIPDPAFHRTGPERFSEYGLPLLARQRRYYFYSESTDDISPAELCCHTLVIDDGPRAQSYCLLLLTSQSVDRTTLRETAEKYGISEQVANLLAYLDSEGTERSGRLPSWDEFAELADEYEVPV